MRERPGNSHRRCSGGGVAAVLRELVGKVAALELRQHLQPGLSQRQVVVGRLKLHPVRRHRGPQRRVERQLWEDGQPSEGVAQPRRLAQGEYAGWVAGEVGLVSQWRLGDASLGLARDEKGIGFSSQNDALHLKEDFTKLDLGRWYCLTVVHTVGDTLKVYINGILEGEAPSSGASLVSDRPLLMGGNDLSGYGITGSLDEVSLYRESLPAKRVLEHYRRGIGATGPMPGAIRDGPAWKARSLPLPPGSSSRWEGIISSPCAQPIRWGQVTTGHSNGFRAVTP